MNISLTPQEALQMARAAIGAAGASAAVAQSLARATVAAECSGQPSVGFAHLLDYLAAFREGRIAAQAEPQPEWVMPAVVQVDARQGIAQLGFDRSFEALAERARTLGVALFVQRNSYPAGQLGYYTRRLAEQGLVAFAASNGPALVGAGAARQAVFGTNPFSFAAPVWNAAPLVIDQATSATAFVNIRAAAERGEALPEGWVTDAQGAPVTDAAQALHGLLQTFGGARGANVALMVEVLAAGVSGARWSMDAPSFTEGSESPGVGLLVMALAPQWLAEDFAGRLASQLQRLAELGVYVPGRRPMRDSIQLPPALVAMLVDAGAAG